MDVCEELICLDRSVDTVNMGEDRVRWIDEKELVYCHEVTSDKH